MLAEYVDNTCDDLMVVNPARVSFGKWKTQQDADFSDNKGSDARLIKFLAEHKHNTPFFHPQISFSLDIEEKDLQFLLSRKEIMTGVEYYKNHFRFSIFSFCSLLNSYNISEYENLNPLIQSMFLIVANEEYSIKSTLKSFGINIEELKEKLSNIKKKYSIIEYNDEFIFQNYKNNPEILRLPFLSIRINVPIFIARQLEKHQVGFFETINECGIKNTDFLKQELFAKNEISRRYVDDGLEFYHPDSFRNRPDKSIKQGSAGMNENNEELLKEYELFIEYSKSYYEKLLSLNVAPEQARMVLPMALKTQWIWTASLSDYFRLCSLRMDEHAQYEARLVGKEIYDICAKKFPKTWKLISESITKWSTFQI